MLSRKAEIRRALESCTYLRSCPGELLEKILKSELEDPNENILKHLSKCTWVREGMADVVRTLKKDKVERIF